MSQLAYSTVAAFWVFASSMSIGCGSNDARCAMPTSFDGRIVDMAGSPVTSVVSGKVCVASTYKTPNFAEPDPMADTTTSCARFQSAPSSGTFSVHVPAPGPVTSGDARDLHYTVSVVADDPVATPIASTIVLPAAGCADSASLTVRLSR